MNEDAFLLDAFFLGTISVSLSGLFILAGAEGGGRIRASFIVSEDGIVPWCERTICVYHIQ